VRPIDSGNLICTLRELKRSGGGTLLAIVGLSGTLVGPTELGYARLTITGRLEFDVDRRFISRLTITARDEILGPNKKQVVAELLGRHEILRQPAIAGPELSDQALENLELKPTRENTSLLLEQETLGLRLLYPRNWQLVSLSGTGLQFHEPTGGNLRIRLDRAAANSLDALFNRFTKWLDGLKATITERSQPMVVKNRFGLTGSHLWFRAEYTVKGREGKQERRRRQFHCAILAGGSRRIALEASLEQERAELLQPDVDFILENIEFRGKQQ